MTKLLSVSTLSNKDTNLNGCVYLVTGASGGLGGATSLALAKQGATVILSGRNEEKLNTIYDQIEQAGYPTPVIFPFDLEAQDDDIYKQFSQSIYNEFKKLDGIVNAACQIGIIGPIASQKGSEWNKVMQVNVNACLMLSKACLPLLQQSSSSSITFISDSSARNNKAYWGAYGTSKVALESFTSILADELESSTINCNVFVPGPSLLPIRKKTHPAESEKNLSLPVQLANAIVQTSLSKQSGQVYTL